MSKAWRIEFDGAIYHALSRGDKQRDIFIEDEDRLPLLELTGKWVYIETKT